MTLRFQIVRLWWDAEDLICIFPRKRLVLQRIVLRIVIVPRLIPSAVATKNVSEPEKPSRAQLPANATRNGSPGTLNAIPDTALAIVQIIRIFIIQPLETMSSSRATPTNVNPRGPKALETSGSNRIQN